MPDDKLPFISFSSPCKVPFTKTLKRSLSDWSEYQGTKSCIVN